MIKRIFSTALVLCFSSPSFASFLFPYYELDECKGEPDGLILVNSNSAGEPVCKQLVQDSARIWSVQVEGVCLEKDHGSVASFCSEFKD